MIISHKKRWVAAALMSSLVGLGAATVRARRSAHVPLHRASLNVAPSVFLWAWERPEDLRFLAADKNVGVAFLANTIELQQQTGASDGPGVIFHPRQQPLRVDASTPLMAVVRIESSHDLWHRPTKFTSASTTTFYSEEQRRQIVELMASTARLPRVSAIQIDFDASESEQPFYAVLLEDIRHRLPQNMQLSITALASWCIGDPWLNKLPAGTIDEAVPMLFRMGPDAEGVSAFVSKGRQFGPSACRSSLGLSTDESLSRSLLNGRISRGDSKRVYVFADSPWTYQAATKVIEEVER